MKISFLNVILTKLNFCLPKSIYSLLMSFKNQKLLRKTKSIGINYAFKMDERYAWFANMVHISHS